MMNRHICDNTLALIFEFAWDIEHYTHKLFLQDLRAIKKLRTVIEPHLLRRIVSLATENGNVFYLNPLMEFSSYIPLTDAHQRLKATEIFNPQMSFDLLNISFELS